MNSKRIWVSLLIVLSAAAALFVSAALGYAWQAFGWGLILGVPFALGLFMAFSLRVRHVLVIIATFIVASSVLGLVIMFEMAGLLCGVVAAAIIGVPMLAGVGVGHFMVSDRERSGPRFVPSALLVFLPPVGLMYAEAELAPSFPPATVATSRTLELAPEDAWDRLVFFEDVATAPPLLARIGLPHPLGTEGEIRGVGDVKTCRYSTGHLTKRVTRYEDARYLEFEILEQVGIEDGTAELLTGSFRFEPLDGDRTRITLTTVYRPLLSARAVWRPFEISLAGAMHDHVLDAIEAADR